MIWEKAFRPFMDERENRRKAKEREQESSGASEKYTQVSFYCLVFLYFIVSHFIGNWYFVLYYLTFIIVIYNSFVTRVVSCGGSTLARPLLLLRLVAVVLLEALRLHRRQSCKHNKTDHLRKLIMMHSRYGSLLFLCICYICGFDEQVYCKVYLLSTFVFLRHHSNHKEPYNICILYSFCRAFVLDFLLFAVVNH